MAAVVVVEALAAVVESLGKILSLQSSIFVLIENDGRTDGQTDPLIEMRGRI